MIKPAVVSLTAYKDRDFDATLIIKEDGVVKDLTGFTAAAQIRPSKLAEAVEDLTVDVTAAEGKIILTLTNAETGALTAGSQFYDVAITETATGEVNNYLEGAFVVRDTVTR